MALFPRTNISPAKVGAEDNTEAPAGPRSAGDVLRQQRTALGLDLADVARELRIKPAYLAALEEGRPDRLPGPAYATGFLRAYGDYLGLDSGEILRRFRLEAAGLDAKPDLSFPVLPGERSLPGKTSLLAALGLTICGYAAWYYLATDEHSRPERVTEVPATLLLSNPAPAPNPAKPAPTPPAAPAAAAAKTLSAAPSKGTVPTPVSAMAKARPSGASSPASTSSPASAISMAPPAPGPAASLPAPAPSGNQGAAASGPPGSPSAEPSVYGATDVPARIVLRAAADSWIQVRDADHRVLFSGVLKAGQSYRVPDQSGLSMRAGNAGGLSVTVDGKPVAPLGPPGAVRNVALNPQSLAATTGHD